MLKESKSESEMEEIVENEVLTIETTEKRNSKPPKKGIIYLSTIPPYMDVSRIREYFGEFGTVCRLYLQLGNQSKSFHLYWVNRMIKVLFRNKRDRKEIKTKIS